MSDALAALNEKFGIPGALRITTGQGGLACVEVGTEACTGRIYFQGAHVTHWQPAGGRPVIWLSRQSWFEAGKPIRGGVPVCWPWFGTGPNGDRQPPHGFARLMSWELEATRRGDGGKVALVMVLRSNEETRRHWPHDFELRLRATFGRELILKLETTNTGRTPFTIGEALHTYLAVEDIERTQVKGLEGMNYIDRLDANRTKRQEGAVTFTAETDRIYLAEGEAQVEEGRRKIRVGKQGSATTVVWNPWIQKAKAMPDFGDEEWPGMVCVETCNVPPREVEVGPGTVQQMRAAVSVEERGA